MFESGFEIKILIIFKDSKVNNSFKYYTVISFSKFYSV